MEVLLDLEIMLVRAHNWTLRDIDETDVTSLLDFVTRYAETEGGTDLTPSPGDGYISPKGGEGSRKAPSVPKRRGGRGKRTYIDQVKWL